MRKNGVRCMVMGGHACVLYGAAEFSRHLDLVILLDESNLDRLRQTLDDLEASPIAIPPLRSELLLRGHAVHFRCQRADLNELRIDIMSRMRGVPPFEELWERRTTIETGGELVDLLSLPDLVLAKKTQFDKDWPMIRRLVEQSFFSAAKPTSQLIAFWLAELRSPELLIQVARQYPDAAGRSSRAAAQAALQGAPAAVESALDAEERRERAADRFYWQPLIKELEQVRMSRRNQD